MTSSNKISNKKVSRQVSVVGKQRPASAPSKGRLNAVMLAMLADLARSGISRREAQRLRVVPLNADDTRTLNKGAFIDPSYRLPYFALDGSVDKSFFRLKRLSLKSDVVDLGATGDAKRVGQDYRYFQPNDTLPRVYLPPLLPKTQSWEKIASDPSIPIYITEGEKKAAKACLMGLVCVGLGGVWNWKSKKGGVALIPDLKTIDWRNRRAIIVFDSDVAGRTSLTYAQNLLSIALTDLGAQVSKIDLPTNEGQPDKKVGLDDYLLRYTLKDFLDLPVISLEYSRELWRLNDEYVFCCDPPATIINRATGKLLSEEQFKSNERPRNVVVNSKPVEAAAFWLKWPMRSQVSKIVHEPRKLGQERHPDNCFNTWNGLGATAAVYDKECRDLFKGLVDHLCAASEPYMKKWLLCWLAFPFQFPGAKIISAPVIHGIPGGGKTLLGYMMGEVYGAANFAEITDELISGQFNDFYAGRQFILADELVTSDGRKSRNKFKSWTSREKVVVNGKNQPHYTIDDHSNYLFASNSAVPISLEENDRRFAVFTVSERLPGDLRKGIGEIYKTERGRNAILHFLLNEVDCSGFNPYADAPMGEAKQHMLDDSKSGVERYIREHIIEHYDDTFSTPRDFQTTATIAALYNNSEQMKGQKPVTYHAVGNILAALAANTRLIARLPQFRAEVSDNGQRWVSAWAFRNVEQWRKTTKHKAKRHWDDATRKTAERFERLAQANGKVRPIASAAKKKRGLPASSPSEYRPYDNRRE
jgi:Domain of unknown function (DUF3854)/Family of unknown function (DUF5906)